MLDSPLSSVVSDSATVPELLAALAETLRRRGFRWYLFGAQAAILWGRPRTSADVDVTVELPLEEVASLVGDLEGAGFELRIRTGVDEFVRRTRVLPFLHRPSQTPVDVVLAGPGLEEEFLGRAVSRRIGGAEVFVISPEDLVVTKILAGRPKDLEDVRGVLAERRDSLDLGSVRSTLELLEAALGQSDLVPTLDSLLQRA